MPKIRRARIPEAVLAHLLDRMRDRAVGFQQLNELSAWLDSDPIVPEGKWFKRFNGFTACGEGELIKTFLRPGQSAIGKEL
jgi:hypothetical protein